MATVFKRGGKSNRGGSYYIQWYDHTGKRKSKSARTTDKATAERIAAKLEADVALRRDGIIDATMDAISKESQRAIDEHLVDCEAKMKSANRDPQHVQSTISYIRRICDTEGFVSAADINADGVIRYAGRLTDQGRSSRTVQAYLTAIKGFTRWLTQHDKLGRDPLMKVQKPNPVADRRRERRILLPEEWQWVRTTIATRPERFGRRPD